MKNRMLELSNELSDLIIDSKVFDGYLELRKFDDNDFKITLTHFHDYYRYNNSSITVYNFNNEVQFENFKNQAIDCIQNNTILKSLGRG